jgi:hypothetical protein
MEACWATQTRTGHDPSSGHRTKMFTDPQTSTASQAQHVIRFTAIMATGVPASIFLDRSLAGEIASLIVTPSPRSKPETPPLRRLAKGHEA